MKQHTPCNISDLHPCLPVAVHSCQVTTKIHAQAHTLHLSSLTLLLSSKLYQNSALLPTPVEIYDNVYSASAADTCMALQLLA